MQPDAETTSTAGSGDLANVLEGDAAALSLPSRLEWVAKTIDFLRQRLVQCGAYEPERIDGLCLALHEALVNAIVHGNLGVSSDLKEQGDETFARVLAERSADPERAHRRVAVDYHHDGCQCVIRITDEGDGFDHQTWIAKLEAETDEAAFTRPSGRGILMMRAFADAVEYREGGRQVIVTLKSRQPERRHAPRLPWSHEVQVLPVSDDGTVDSSRAWTAAGRDLSTGGAALVQNLRNVPLPEGQADVQLCGRVLLQVENPRTHRPVYIPAEICRATTMDGGLLNIGCRFTGEPLQEGPAPAQPTRPVVTPQAVRDLIESLQATPTVHERRAHARVPYSARIEVRLPDGTRRTAFSRDLSFGGMAMVTSFQIPLVEVEIALPSDTRPDGRTEDRPSQLIRARVVRCQRVTAGVFDIGLQFV